MVAGEMATSGEVELGGGGDSRAACSTVTTPHPVVVHAPA